MKRRAPDGFTLLELLLAISLLGMITAAIMGGIHLGRRSWETTRASDALDEVENAMRATSALLAKSFAVTPDPMQIGGEGPPPVFLGSPQGCRFVMLSEGGGQWGGLILTEIGLDNGPDGLELAVWTKVYRPKDGLSLARGAMKKTVVLAGLSELEISYFGAQQQGARASTWSGKWSSANLPALVSIRVGAKRLGRIIEIDTRVAPRQQ
jgi:general secretion pathway protein J